MKNHSRQSSPDWSGYAVERLPLCWGTAFERKAGPKVPTSPTVSLQKNVVIKFLVLM